MNFFKKFALFISLSPFIAAIYIASLNNNKSISIKVLTWESQERSLGAWITIGTIVGFSFSFINNLSFQYKSERNKRQIKKTIRNSKEEKDYSSYGNQPSPDSDINNQFENDLLDFKQSISSDNYDYIERDYRDPSPTISVPYKIITKNTNTEEGLDPITSTSASKRDQERPTSTYVNNDIPKYDDWLNDSSGNW